MTAPSASNASAPPKSSAPETKTPFEEFLLAEYDNIAHAHFNTVDSLANFIKHYIAIASIPFAIAAIFLDTEKLKATGLWSFILDYPVIVPLFLTVLSLIGLFVLAYIVNIRFDAILYARTVNGIRKYFYDRSRLPLESEIRIRALPRTTNLPNYIEGEYFGFVVLTFMLVGSSYFGAGWYYYWHRSDWPTHWFIVLITSFAALHWLMYAKLAEHREKTYLQKQIIGVDVDGVLNAHRDQFSKILESQTEKKLLPDAITHIPVHEMTGSNVSESDANAVFNRADYWVEMPIFGNNVADTVRKLRNVLGYRVWIFTYRPWPEPAMFPPGQERAFWSRWGRSSLWARVTRYLHGIDAWLENQGARSLIRGRLMYAITKRWLKQHGIQYDKLVVEGGNTSTADARMLSRNRYIFAKKYAFRAFVEDTLSNALKLSNICQVVFLIHHPYNQCAPESLPPNVVRVKSWPEIHKTLRSVF